MRITHIRLRALRSHEHGYGHDAAEIEAALDPGDDPDEVAQRVRQRMEDELRQGADGKRLYGIMAQTPNPAPAIRQEHPNMREGKL